jgi:glycosyltransferase involved in cell wall biosynthesis
MKRLVIFVHFIILTIIFLPKIIRVKGKPDLVYARAPILFSSLIGFIYSRLTRAFFVYEAPDLWPEELVAFKTPLLPLIMSLGKLAAKISYILPDVILTISEPAAKLIIREYHPAVPVYGIPVGVDPGKFARISRRDARQELLKRQVLPEPILSKFIVLYSGLLSEAQRVELLVYAAMELKNKKDIAIVIIGDGPQKEKLQHLKVNNNLENLYFLERQPREMMPVIISAADICAVMLSNEPIFDIALPTKFYEYLASCKPLVGVCSGILADIITSTGIGQVVGGSDPKEIAFIILEFASSTDLVHKMEDNCLGALKQFSLNAIASEIEDVLGTENIVPSRIRSI